MDRIALARRAALAGWLGLVVLFPLWYGIVAPPPGALAWLAVALFVLPLLAVAPGLLRAHPRTHTWSGLLALPYLCHALVELVASPAQRRFALLELLLSLSLYAGGMLYGRWRARQARGETMSGKEE